MRTVVIGMHLTAIGLIYLALSLAASPLSHFALPAPPSRLGASVYLFISMPLESAVLYDVGVFLLTPCACAIIAVTLPFKGRWARLICLAAAGLNAGGLAYLVKMFPGFFEGASLPFPIVLIFFLFIMNCILLLMVPAKRCAQISSYTAVCFEFVLGVGSVAILAMGLLESDPSVRALGGRIAAIAILVVANYFLVLATFRLGRMPRVVFSSLLVPSGGCALALFFSFPVGVVLLCGLGIWLAAYVDSTSRQATG